LVRKGRSKDGKHLLLGALANTNWDSLDVVKGKLPDDLHSRLMLLSYEHTDDEDMKEYMARQPR